MNVIIALVAFIAGVIATRLYMTLKKSNPVSDVQHGGGGSSHEEKPKDQQNAQQAN